MKKIKKADGKIRDYVNRFDKSFNVKLKRKKDVIYKEIDNQIDIFESSLKRIMCALNDIDEEYLSRDIENETTEKMFIPKNYKRVETASFEELSSLHWLDNDNSTFKTNSSIFRKRFITLILSAVIENIEFIAYNMVDQSHSEDELTLMRLNEMITNSERFITDLNAHTTKMLAVRWCHFMDSHKFKCIKKINNCIDDIMSICNTSIIIRKQNHDLMLYYIAQLAYFLATDSTTKSIKYESIEGYRLGDDASSFLKYVGEKINSKDRSLVFDAFIVASPNVPGITDNDDRDIITAKTALAFVDFILSDIRWVRRFIKNI